MKLESIEELYSIYSRYPSVVTDTRKLNQGDLYFALKGPNFNGNLFAIAALEAGASYAIVDELIANSDSYQDRIILVQDVLTTLQQLAKYHRQQFDIPFIAITGSNGKTTTKELVYSVLASHFKTYTTQGNLNNHIGVPLTLLSIPKNAAMAVIEMGANHQKEIESYCAYTLPTFGMITNCGKAHLEGFGGVEGVKKGKGELYDYLRNNNRITEKVNFIDSTFLTSSPSALHKEIKNSYLMPNPSDVSFEILKNYENKCKNDVFFAMSHGVHRGELKKGKFDNRELFINKLKKLN